MKPRLLFSDYFQDELSGKAEFPVTNIHIISTTSTAGPSQQGVPQGPNWNDPSSIYEWLQQFIFNRSRNRLVRTFGKDFKFYGRDHAIETLWKGDSLTNRNGIKARYRVRNESDKRLHPIPVLAGGPGTGKSRFLDEIERLLKQCADESDDEKIRDAFTNIVVINTVYGNGSPFAGVDKEIGAEESLALRILYEYFQPHHIYGKFDFPSFRSECNKYSQISKFSLSTALQVVYLDKMGKGNDTLLVLVLGIDEFNSLHDDNKEACKILIKQIGGTMCRSPTNIFFVPILSGTVEGPLEQYITGSMHKPLHIPLYLLDEDQSIEIGKTMKLFDDKYSKLHPYFRLGIGDIGGHVRSLERFYEDFTRESEIHNKNPYKVKIGDIMNGVKHGIKNEYNLIKHSKWLSEVLAKAILGLQVNKEDEIIFEDKPTSYQDLSSMGIISLVLDPKTDRYYIQIPYLWASIIVEYSDHPGMECWKSMLEYDEPMYYANFEDFNARFWALRLSLFRLLGYEKIELGNLLKGAKLSRDFPVEIEVILPKDINLCKLRHRYPVTETNKDKKVNEMRESFRCYTVLDLLNNQDIEKYMDCVFLNAKGAPWDVFSLLRYHNDSKVLWVTEQVKISETEALEPMIITQKIFDEEHTKVSDAINEDNWILLFLTNAEAEGILSIKCKKNSALVSRKQFKGFYGYTHASRAQFASTNEKIHINSIPKETLLILGFTDDESNRIDLKRKQNPLQTLDDINIQQTLKFMNIKHKLLYSGA
ncbi:unnamed protein product [Rhizophagus irregularis]|nr:unnamed protein product [Rhizophagus irregularis]